MSPSCPVTSDLQWNYEQPRTTDLMPRTAPEPPATKLPLLHAMEERAGERKNAFNPTGHVALPERIALSPALSHSFVVGEGENLGGQCADSPRTPFVTFW